MAASSPDSSPDVDYTQEVRFAVVMYGGVSLAIYINGIAQELLRWVRATAKHATKDVASIPSNPPTGVPSSVSGPRLSPTERVYRKLSYILAERGHEPGSDEAARLSLAEKKLAANETIRTRFVVDILSGTSAGGINGIFLAKALANGQDISGLENLWIEEGDMKTLINDKKSVETPLSLQEPPASLLNSERMYLELLKAFDSMEDSGAAAQTPYVDELDLFVTTTDLSGVTLPIRLSDGVVYERRHRNVLRFVYSNREVSGDKERNDFESKYNPFLAFAARCTSAFPVAFEPMCLCDTDTILERYGSYAADKNCRSENTEWQRFYKDYLNPAGVHTVKFPKRPFADGGYLDNKPFTYATETLARRQANLLVTRKLIYIEPSPEHPEEEPETEGKPDAIENVGAALLTLPRYETIREDLQRVRDHNRLVERVNKILDSVDEDIRRAAFERKPQCSDDEWGKLDLAEVINFKGPGYVAYHRLEIDSVTDDLARLVTRVARFDEESDYFLIIRSLVRAWRLRNYIEHGKGLPSLNTFLFEFNLAYPMRRINFLRTKITERSNSDTCRVSQQAQDELRDIKTKLNKEYKNLKHTSRLLRSRQAPAKDATTESAASPPSPAFEAIENLKMAIAAEAQKQLPKVRGAEPRDRGASKGPVEPVLEYFLGNRLNGGAGISGNIEEECFNRAKDFLKANPSIADLFSTVATVLKAHIVLAKETADTECRAALELTDASFKGSRSKPPTSEKDSREYLGYYYQYYDEYDRIIFPILYGTEIGEAAKVDIIRISPEDAKALIDERKMRCYKLAGTALGHFGAFLDPLWRKNDILWGRLDGAERIITALLPNEPKLARMLIGEAHVAIVHEAIAKPGVIEARDLLCESAMRPASRNADCNLLSQFIENLKTHDGAGQLKDLIDDKALRQHYVDTFPTRSRLEPESTVKTAARATTVIGKMLSALSDRRNVDSNFVAWIARFGQIFSSLVEVSVPRSIPNLLFRHWLKLLYLFESLLIVGATLLTEPSIAQLGWTLLGITASINIVAWWLSDFMQRKRTVFRFLILLMVTGFFLLALIGGLKIAWLFFGLNIDGLPPLNWISHNLQQLSALFKSKLPTAVWQLAQKFWPLVAVLFAILVLWKLGGQSMRKQELSKN